LGKADGLITEHALYSALGHDIEHCNKAV